jgi:beta-aspartyl-peptidase (threonine type)
MRNLIYSLFLLILAISCSRTDDKPAYVLVVHGGAGTATKADYSPESAQQYIDKISEVLNTGQQILEQGGTSMDAVEAAIRIMEDSPLFNAGRGAVFNALGQNELDASFMDGKNLDAGAVAGVRTIKNPISAARAVMEKSGHVMLTGEGAERFAGTIGLEMVDTSYFFTQGRWNSYQRVRERKEKEAGKSYSTVGAVALDKYGNLAAGTSTGGMTFKMPGRVGDSPIIGAGTYANNNTCAVSATGHGEFFIRNVIAYDISARMEYAGMSLQEASNDLVHNKLKALKANGGVIAVDKHGNIAMPFNTESMIRGYVNSKGDMQIVIYEE